MTRRDPRRACCARPRSAGMDGGKFLRAIHLEPAFASLPVLLAGAINTVFPDAIEVVRKPLRSPGNRSRAAYAIPATPLHMLRSDSLT